MAQDMKTVQWVLISAQNNTGAKLWRISDILLRCPQTAQRLLNKTHPSYSLYTLLLPSKEYRNICYRTTRLQISFCPRAMRPN